MMMTVSLIYIHKTESTINIADSEQSSYTPTYSISSMLNKF